MNTPAHLLIGAAAFGRHKTTMGAAMVGGLLPDLSLYVLTGVSLFLLNIPASVVFNELYFSVGWQSVFAIDNSLLVWSALLALAYARRSGWAMALCAAALLHIACDLPLHHDDGRPHFWPLTGWVFESPLSYWDTAHGASWIGPLEGLLALVAAVLLWRNRLGLWRSLIVLALLAAEFWIVRTWLFFFVDSV